MNAFLPYRLVSAVAAAATAFALVQAVASLADPALLTTGGRAPAETARVAPPQTAQTTPGASDAGSDASHREHAMLLAARPQR